MPAVAVVPGPFVRIVPERPACERSLSRVRPPARVTASFAAFGGSTGVGGGGTSGVPHIVYTSLIWIVFCLDVPPGVDLVSILGVDRHGVCQCQSVSQIR